MGSRSAGDGEWMDKMTKQTIAETEIELKIQLAQARAALSELKQANRLRGDRDTYLFELAEWGLGIRETRPDIDYYGIEL
jgi:hypothetical protein